MRVRSHLLAKLSPLLGAAVGLEAGDSFSATLTPLQMHLPAECYALRLEPLKLVLATRGLLSGVIALLKWVPSSAEILLKGWIPDSILAWKVNCEPYCNQCNNPPSLGGITDCQRWMQSSTRTAQR